MKATLLFVLTLSGLSVLPANSFREYHHLKIAKTWAEAQSYCREKFTDLAAVDNQDNNDRLHSVSRGRGNIAWIGLYDDSTTWKWVQGNVAIDTDEDFSNWGSGEPVAQPHLHSCVLMTENGEWSTSLCQRSHPAVCYYEQGPSRYILVENRTNWQDAKTYCRSRYTDFVSVRNMSENQRISSLLTEKTWIGLIRKHWIRWSDHSRRSFSNWESGQPDNTEGSCAVINTVTGKWRVANCMTKYYFTCQRVQEHKTTLKLKFRSEADLNDPAVQQQILEQLHAKLEKHVLSDFKLRWIETDGQTFHKEQKREEEEESAG